MVDTDLFCVGSVSSEAVDKSSSTSGGSAVTSLELSRPMKALGECSTDCKGQST